LANTLGGRMSIEKFLQSIYLGDRYCKKAEYDKDKRIYTIQMNGISRIRSDDGQWNYYIDEDIMDGEIVFEGVESVKYEFEQFECNDEIYDIQSTSLDDGLYEFTVSGSYAVGVEHTDGNVKIIAKDIYLCDPQNPLLKIKE